MLAALATVLSVVAYGMVLESNTRVRLTGLVIKLITALMFCYHFKQINDFSLLPLTVFYTLIDLRMFYKVIRLLK